MRLPVPAVIALYFLSVGCDLYILSRIRRAVGKDSVWSKIYLWSSVACWIFLTVVVCLPKRDSDSGIVSLMWMLYAYLTVYLPKILIVVCSLAGGIPRLWKHRGLKTGLYVGLPLGVVAFYLLWWGAASCRYDIEVSRVDLSFEKLPDSFDGYRILQFSDAHVGTWGEDVSFIADMVDSINSLNPDLILFTGDIVNRQTSELAPFLEVLSGLRAKDGVYSVLGNHDYGDYVDWKLPSERVVNNELLAQWQRQMGWRLLNNERVFIRSGKGDSIMLIGVENWGDPPFPQYGDLELALSASPDSLHHQNDSNFKILMTHNPEHWNREVSCNTNIDLSLAGHTHAMQSMIKVGRFKWSPAKYRYEQWGGLYSRPNSKGDTTNLYVNIGVGEVGMPARVGAVPELTLITLHRKD